MEETETVKVPKTLEEALKRIAEMEQMAEENEAVYDELVEAYKELKKEKEHVLDVLAERNRSLYQKQEEAKKLQAELNRVKFQLETLREGKTDDTKDDSNSAASQSKPCGDGSSQQERSVGLVKTEDMDDDEKKKEENVDTGVEDEQMKRITPKSFMSSEEKDELIKSQKATIAALRDSVRQYEQRLLELQGVTETTLSLERVKTAQLRNDCERMARKEKKLMEEIAHLKEQLQLQDSDEG